MAFGRSSNFGLTVTIFGATGYTGRYLAHRFGKHGCQVVIPYRCDEYDVGTLKVVGDLGKIHLNRFHLKEYSSIVDCVKHSQVVINLIAQDRKSINFDMRSVNVVGAGDIARACAEAGVSRLIHTSCLLANHQAVSEYARSKAEGEHVVRQVYKDAIIVRPSTIFGAQDKFINNIAQFTRMWTGFPVVGRGEQVRRPIHIGDIADAIFLLATRSKPYDGRTFELWGPKAYTYRRIVEMFAYAAMCPPTICNLTPWQFWLYGKIFPELYKTKFPFDNILQLLDSELPTTDKDSHPAPQEKRVMNMQDLGFSRLNTLEEHMLDICRSFRKTNDAGQPLEFPPELLADSVGGGTAAPKDTMAAGRLQ